VGIPRALGRDAGGLLKEHQREQSLLRLSSIVLFAFISQSMMAPLVPLLGLKLGAGPVAIGGLVGIGSLLPLLVAVRIGRSVDRVGPRKLAFRGSLLLAAGPVAVALAPSLGTLAVAQILAGLGQTLLAVASQTLAATIGTGTRRERSFGLYTSAVSIGQLIGPITAGFLAERIGFPFAFAASGVAGALAFAFCRGVVPTVAATKVTVPSDWWASTKADLVAARRLLNGWGMRVTVVVSLTLLFGATAFATFLPVHLALLGYTPTVVGFLLGARAFTAVLVRPFLPSILRLLRNRSFALAAMTGCIAFALSLTGFATDLAWLALLTVLVGIGTGIAPPLTMIVVVEHVPLEDQGFALGIRLTANRLAHIAAPIIVGALAEWFGLTGALLVGGLIASGGVTTIMLWSWAFEAEDRDRRAIARG